MPPKTIKFEEPESVFKRTGPIKFKDKPGRGGINIDFMQVFGFIPERILIQKVQGENNTIVVSAPHSAKVVPQLINTPDTTKVIEKGGETK